MPEIFIALPRSKVGRHQGSTAPALCKPVFYKPRSQVNAAIEAALVALAHSPSNLAGRGRIRQKKGRHFWRPFPIIKD
jgi:hypothetical protein